MGGDPISLDVKMHRQFGQDLVIATPQVSLAPQTSYEVVGRSFACDEQNCKFGQAGLGH